MARRFFRPLTSAASFALRASLLIGFATLLPAMARASGTPSPSPFPAVINLSTPASTAKPAAAAKSSPDPAPKSSVPDEWAEASRIFDELSPDQRKKFLDNLNQWKAMSPEEQELFRDRDLFRRQKIAAEIQDAANKTGLHLDDDQREIFALRYTQERRKIEDALRKETDQQRQTMVSDMIARLRLEFSSSTPPPIPIPPGTPPAQ